ncbi:hypothetical protein CTI12_AA147730 [Artemisia annua]|uniref:Uncharacterized protein n=1 Tax=Artemisia annua TaxID=35608 RepID=A0A2U1PIE4_ARTAN|nr:hypothetical protein CTI12_AA147730 [Artemisia annua]
MKIWFGWWCRDGGRRLVGDRGRQYQGIVFIDDLGQSEVERLASGTGCSASSLPFNYLGLPVGVNMKNEASWCPVIDKYVAMKSSRLGLVCFFFLVILLAKVSGAPQWELLEALANRNVTNLDPNMEAITGIDDDLYQMWLFNGGSSSSDIIDFLTQYVEKREYIKNKIDMVGSILFGPEKHCGFQSQPYIKYRRLFVNMCNHVGEDKASIKEAIIAACGNNKSYGGVCRDASMGLCQCDKDDWRPLSDNRLWSFVMSPYENKIVDVKFTSGIHGFVDISLDEGSQGWRYFFLTMGTALLFLAPSVC